MDTELSDGVAARWVSQTRVPVVASAEGLRADLKGSLTSSPHAAQSQYYPAWCFSPDTSFHPPVE
jgi:hypothetical protein